MEPAATPAFAEPASLEEPEAAMHTLAEGLDGVPVLAPEALTCAAVDEHP